MPLQYDGGDDTARDTTFAPPANLLALAPLAPPSVASAPTAGQGFALNETGDIPVSATFAGFRTFTNGDTTPSVAGGVCFATNNTGATTITTFDDGASGQRITIVFTDANTTLTDGGNLKLAGGFTSTADDTMELIFNGTTWFELGRSVN